MAQKSLVHPWGQQLCPTDRLHSTSWPWLQGASQLWETSIPGMFWSSAVLQIIPVKALQFSEEAKFSSTSLTPTWSLHQPHADTCWNLAIIRAVWLDFCLSYLRPPWLLLLLSPKDLSTKIHRRAAGINLQLSLQKKEPGHVSRWQRRVFKHIAKFSKVSQQCGREKITLKVQLFSKVFGLFLLTVRFQTNTLNCNERNKSSWSQGWEKHLHTEAAGWS